MVACIPGLIGETAIADLRGACGALRAGAGGKTGGVEAPRGADRGDGAVWGKNPPELRG